MPTTLIPALTPVSVLDGTPSVGTTTTLEVMPATIEDSFGADAPENSELRKIAQDVLDAAKYTLIAVAANPDQQVRPNSLEAAFREGFNKLDAGKRTNIQQAAKALADAPEAARMATFGRYGKFTSKDMLGLGFARADEALPALKIDKKLLGLATPTIAIPVDAITRTPEGGLHVPADRLPTDFQGLDGFDMLAADFEDARATAARDGIANTERLNALWGLGDGMSAAGMDMDDSSEFEAAVTDKLGFYITRVKCVDETNPEFWGSDEIAIAGITVDETGDTKQVGEKYVGGGFDDDNAKNYAPHWRFTWFNLREQHGYPGPKWPKMYFVTLLLAEKDHGGFSSALDKVWKKIGDQVKAKIQAAVTGALSGLMGPVIAAAIGKVAAWVVDMLVGWIISLFKDDLFPPYVAKLKVWNLSATWPGGSKTSPLKTATFSGHGGLYQVQYYWKLYA